MCRGILRILYPVSCSKRVFLRRAVYILIIGENILADMVLATLPITSLYNLQLSLRIRFNLCILLGLGFL